jgi:serine protease AprX
MRRATTYLIVLTALVAVSFSGSASGSSGTSNYSYGQNVDPSLVTTINQGQATAQSTFHVIVFGAGLSAPTPPAGAPAPPAPPKPAPGPSWTSSYSWRDSLNAVGAASTTLTAAQISQLSTQPGVQFVTADTPMAPASNGSSSQLSASQLATLYPQIDGAPALWSAGTTGAGVGVAVIDSGVTPRADFGSRLVQVQLPTQDGTALVDNVGHGSAVAGVVAGNSADGKYIGIAPGASLYAINVARSDGVYTSDVIAGLNWVLQNAKADNIRVVNLSLSQTTPSSYYTSTLDAVVDQLWKQGIVVVVAAGNFGANSEQFAPANDPWAITVGASDSNDTPSTSDDSLAEFSSYGTTPDGFAKPEIVAPGRHIVTSIPGNSTIAQAAPAGYLVGSGQDNYVRISGTSFAAPQVAGAAALLLQQHSNLNPDQIKWALTQTERSLSGSNAGALDLVAASNAAAHPANSNGGYRWSNWAHPGENTTDFLTSLGNALQIVRDEIAATTKDVQATVACLKATLTPAPRAPKGSTVPAPNPAFNDCAQHLDDAAAAWDTAAGEWSSAGKNASASTDEKKAGNDYQSAAGDWTKAGNTAHATADTANQAAAWDTAAAWDSAAWDTAAAWDHSAAWDAAAWDSATWDHAAAWDSAAWDSAAWDAAAWDAAAWD